MFKTLNVEEVARYCHCHPETIRQHIRSGKLLACRIGRRYFIEHESLQKYVKSNQAVLLQASYRRNKCHSSLEMEFGTLTFAPQAVKELDVLLEQIAKTKR